MNFEKDKSFERKRKNERVIIEEDIYGKEA